MKNVNENDGLCTVMYLAATGLYWTAVDCTGLYLIDCTGQCQDVLGCNWAVLGWAIGPVGPGGPGGQGGQDDQLIQYAFGKYMVFIV